jgi:7,8-dihydropterin-6-yl-methyl-4-(beta-D-ribofuranosyl)aminobenzene 5'-phosphate synthase
MRAQFKLTCVVEDGVPLDPALRHEHGLSFLIETGEARVLFDTGPRGEVLLHNMEVLGIDPRRLTALALSHGHYDHVGGLSDLLAHTPPHLPLYANPDLFRERFSRRKPGLKSVGMSIGREELAARFTLHLHAEPTEIAAGIWTTGEITDRPELEGTSEHHFVRGDGGFIRDPYRDDLSLVLETDAGLVAVCGCCHAGLLNTLAQVRRIFEREIVAVIGGTHLMNMDEAGLAHIVAVLRETYNSPRLYLNHCTGDKAIKALQRAFGERVASCPTGTVLTF